MIESIETLASLLEYIPEQRKSLLEEEAELIDEINQAGSVGVENESKNKITYIHGQLSMLTDIEEFINERQ